MCEAEEGAEARGTEGAPRPSCFTRYGPTREVNASGADPSGAISEDEALATRVARYARSFRLQARLRYLASRGD